MLILPAKDTVEELFWKQSGMTNTTNFIVTFLLVLLSYVLALFIPGIGDAIMITGSTINPFVGIQLFS